MRSLAENQKDFKKLLRRAKYTVWTKLSHVSQSGMTRTISAYVIVDNEPQCIDFYIEQLGTYKRTKLNARHEGLTVSGCGMDMGFSLVYNTSRQLYPKGFKSSSRNAGNGMKPTDKGYEWDTDGGYRLKQRWL